MYTQLIIRFACYLIIINFVASMVTIADKSKAQSGKWRVPEARLFALALFGGTFGEFVTMRLIRHKTKHMRFMIGLPLIMIIHVAIIVFIVLKVAS